MKKGMTIHGIALFQKNLVKYSLSIAILSNPNIINQAKATPINPLTNLFHNFVLTQSMQST